MTSRDPRAFFALTGTGLEQKAVPSYPNAPPCFLSSTRVVTRKIVFGFASLVKEMIEVYPSKQYVNYIARHNAYRTWQGLAAKFS
eukprot:5763984-Amphidinium_carterae.1